MFELLGVSFSKICFDFERVTGALCACGLLCGPVFAQPSERYVDSEQACSSVGGEWKMSRLQRTERACALPASDADSCAARDGHWIHERGTPDMSGGCEAPRSALAAEERKDCEERGGEWIPMGLSQRAACRFRAKDAGKICQRAADCEFGCDYEGPGWPPKGAAVTGRCRPSNDPFGCRIPVDDGKAGGGSCLD
jgi:hypothetical protein